MSSNITKLAYAYGGLLGKTAQNAAPLSPEEQAELQRLKDQNELRKAREEAEAAKPGTLGQMGAKFKSDKDYRQTMMNRATLGGGALALGGGAGAVGANAAIQRMRQAGFSEAEIRNQISVGGGAARGAAKTMLGGGIGAGLGYGAGMLYNHLQDKDEDKIQDLESQLGSLGGVIGGIGGAYSGYSDEMSRANEAVANREMRNLMEAAAKGKKYRSILM